MQHNYIADQLIGISDLLKTFDSIELMQAAMTLTLIGAEVRKHAFKGSQMAVDGKKPEPRRIDPNSMIPRPVAPKGPSGPVRLSA